MALPLGSGGITNTSQGASSNRSKISKLVCLPTTTIRRRFPQQFRDNGFRHAVNPDVGGVLSVFQAVSQRL